MDNHKWALWVWERQVQIAGIAKFTLVHADHHWDGGYDAYYDQEKSSEIVAADLEQLRAIIDEEEWIRYDSFIAPAVLRGRFDCLHFFCKQDDDFDVAIGHDLLDSAGATQVLHPSTDSLAAITPEHPLIFDLCLDLFNRESKMEYGSDLWADAEINEFLLAMRPLIESANLVTISLSFGCSGSEPDTRHLAQLVVPQIAAWRGS
ncbi:UPF0489 family protein [Variovorax ginsengisoli]|uniref:UPF0489 family protein n=1 Tax=Variovorax ginsengisoli TaxID=363844 RepID=A0ABT8SEJ7_9BURK|nr:UPF0489 family protein [Variovorax ginsengisoli]MDN8617995.1 UPF0489 family protein [Variovorax ginsengisoli]MDO1537165.1 UPF0489 family protein [Variovorax ginsengisoli]